MIRAVDLGNNSERPITVQELLTLDIRNFWLELVDPTSDELQAVAQRTVLPMEFLHLPIPPHRVNLRLEEGYTVVNFAIPKSGVNTNDVSPIVIATAKTFLVTVNKNDDEYIIATAKARMSKTKIDQPAIVSYFILDEIVNTHFVRLEKLEKLTAHIEEEVVEKTSAQTLKKIFKLKARLISFNKLLWYERSLIFNLMNCSDSCMPARSRGLFSKVHEDLTRQIDIVSTYREILSDAINVHLSAVSNKINLSIKSLTIIIFYLTIITTVTSFPNTVATFFGISQFGETNVIIVAIAIVLSIVLPFLWLWRRKWLKYSGEENDAFEPEENPVKG